MGLILRRDHNIRSKESHGSSGDDKAVFEAGMKSQEYGHFLKVGSNFGIDNYDSIYDPLDQFVVGVDSQLKNTVWSSFIGHLLRVNSIVPQPTSSVVIVEEVLVTEASYSKC